MWEDNSSVSKPGARELYKVGSYDLRQHYSHLGMTHTSSASNVIENNNLRLCFVGNGTMQCKTKIVFVRLNCLYLSKPYSIE